MENGRKRGAQVSEYLLSSDILDVGEPRPGRSIAKWRTVIKANLVLVGLVLVINIAIFAWAWTRPSHSGGFSTAFSGSCTTMSRTSIWAHLAINLLSTILLGAGNYCVQCLIAPTRQQLDGIHARQRWLDVGLISFRNFKASSGRNKVLILFICLSSIPLHLIYNSVIVGTPSANEYMALIVAPAFLTGGPWQDYNLLATAELLNRPEVQYLQDHINQLTRLDNADCMSAYRNAFVSDWTNVLLVSNAPQTQHTLIDGFNFSPATDIGNWNGAPEWMLNPDNTLQNANDWVRYEPLCNGTIAGQDFEYFCTGTTGGQVAVKIEYCLAQPFQAKCSIRISTIFLAVIMVCNVTKFVCILAALSAASFKPLLTIGDAVCSFLEYPDSNTRYLGPISAQEVPKLLKCNFPLTDNGSSALQEKKSWKTKSRRWFSGASGRRWAFTLSCCILTWIACLILLKLAVNWGAVWTKGIGVINPNSLVSISAGHGLATNTLLANLPQFVISLLYVLYNGMLTSVLLTAEFCDFTRRKKGLRVSDKPTGDQRSTYWLQLPYRYALPMMTVMAVLHWLVSQSIFLVNVSTYDNNGIRVPGRDISACGYSMYGLVASLSVGLLLIVALLLCGCQKLGKGAPIVRSCSLAISAAANGRAQEATLPLMYGVLSHDDNRFEHKSEGETRRKVGFGANEVHPLVDGEIY